MHDRLRMESGRTRAEEFNDILAEPRPAARRRHHQRPSESESFRLLADARQRAGGEDDALRRNVVGEGGGHARPTLDAPRRRSIQ